MEKVEEITNTKIVDIINSINELEKILETAPNTIFNSQVIKLDRPKVEEQLKQIVALIPKAFDEAMDIIENKNQILSEAKELSKSMKEETEADIKKMLDTHEIVKEASKYAQQIRDKAKLESIEMQTMGVRHADEKLQLVEYRIKALLNNIHEEVKKFENYLSEVMEVVQEERTQIKNTIEHLE